MRFPPEPALSLRDGERAARTLSRPSRRLRLRAAEGWLPPEALPAALAAAYRATSYRVLLPGRVLTARIGRRAPCVDAALARAGALTATFITAWNPRSRPTGAARNRAAGARLEIVLRRLGQRIWRHEGRGRGWPAERGPLALDLPDRMALALAILFDQAAVVRIARGGRAVLLATPERRARYCTRSIMAMTSEGCRPWRTTASKPGM